MFFEAVHDSIGSTPLIRLRLDAREGVEVCAKLETHNPFAMDMLLEARRWAVLHDVEKEARRTEAVASLDAAMARRDKLEHEFYVEGSLAEDRFKTLSAEQSAGIESLGLEAAELARGADLSVFFADGEALADSWAGACSWGGLEVAHDHPRSLSWGSYADP
ncbi:cysteine synthase [Streptomyces laurentii]|uniref:Cysteine synthase n=1 Tax=Streptomyces laurentii TaxID=39478 RepID=A0A160P725_STRLU|nr:cysteine synthase [Streptomyces laurentii]